MAISEKIKLLGAGLYKDIPDELTLTSIPTASELDYVGAEDFDQTMLDKIFPQVIEEKIDFKNLLEMDYYWICRCLRILNYGPYITVNRIFCGECNTASNGEYRVNLNTVECATLPEGFVNNLTVKKDEFMDFDGSVTFKLPTIQKMLNAFKDKAFQTSDGKVQRELARMCYMISEIGGNRGYTPVEIKMFIQNRLSPADYIILRDTMTELSNYGLKAGGKTVCPNCGSPNAAFVAFVDDRLFRPTLGDLREWKNSRIAGSDENISGSKTTDV